jgi:hypothetical protein
MKEETKEERLKIKLDSIIYRCVCFDSNDGNIQSYERYKKEIKRLNLLPDIYELAIQKIAGIIGI